MAVKIRVSADTSAARSDLSRLEKSVGNIDKTTKNVTRSLTRLAQGIATAFGATVAIKSINNATNSLIELENRVALVTGRTKQLGTSLNNLYDIARKSRQPVSLAAETFNRFGIALREANVSVEDIEKATLAVQRSVTLSGGNIESARAAIFQLGQGLASGTLRGQELNSVLEQAPRIATAIADDLNVGVGALRAMAAEGQITTDVVFNSLLNQSSKLEKEFEALESTSSKAFVVFNDTLKRTVGEISRVLGITQIFTDTFNDLTQVLLNSSTIFELDLYAGITGFNDALLDTQKVLGGVLNVTKAFTSRFADFIGNIIGPTQTVLLQLEYIFLQPIMFIESQYKKLGKNIGRILESSIFRGTNISTEDIFFAENAEDAREKLDTLANDIDKYGRRWYNFGFQIQSALNPAINTIDTLILRIGILLKRLNIYKVSITDVISSFNVLNTIVKPIKDLFDVFSEKALSNISKAKDFIVNALDTIERKFFFVYDKVIGNSWWTDTMESTYLLARNFLGKTINEVNNFSSIVIDKYKTAFESAKKSLQGLSGYTSLSDINIKVELQQQLNEFLDNPKDYITKALEGLLNNIGKPIADAVSILYRELNEIYPFLSAIVASIFGTFLIGIFSSSLATGMRKFIGFGLLASLGAIIANSFGDNIIDSGVVKNFAKGLGQAAGAFVDLIIKNIPDIIRAFGQVIVGFGQGLADSLTGVFGFVSKLLMSLPIINIIPGLISAALVAYFTGFGPKKLVSGFISSRQKQFDKASKGLTKSAQKASGKILNSAPQIGFMESVLIGRGGGRATLGKSLAIITALDVALGSFIGKTAFTDFILSAGLIADLLFGRKGTKFIAASIASIFAKIKIAASSLNSISGLQSFISQLNPTNIAMLWNTAMFKAGQAVGFFAKATNLSMLSVQTMSTVTAALSQNRFVAAFRRIQASSTLMLNGISRNTRRVILGGLVGAFLLWSSTAQAATQDVNEEVNGLFSNILSKVNGFLSTPVGMLTGLIFGSAVAGTAGTLILKQVGSILGAISLKIAGFVGGLKIARAGVLSLAILGSGSILAGVTTVLAGVGAAIASFAASAAAIVAGVALIGGVVGIAVFGEGDSLGDKFANAENDVRRFFGIATRSAKRLKTSLVDSLGGFDKIGDIDVNFKPFLDSFRFEDINAEETKRLQRVAKKTNKILEGAQKSIETNGDLSRSETRRVKRAIDIAKTEIVNANLGLDQGESGGASKSGIASRRALLEPFNNLLNNRAGNLLTGGREIANALNLAQKASDDVVASFGILQNEIKNGTPTGIGFAISDILNNDKVVNELSQSLEGTTFIKALDQIAAVTSGINANAIDTDSFNELFTGLSQLGSALDLSEASGLNYGNLQQDVADQILTDLEESVSRVRNKAQSRVRSDVEGNFLKAVESANKFFEGTFDLGKLDEGQIAALSTDSLRNLTKILEIQVKQSTAAFAKDLQSANQNVLPDEIRQQFLKRQKALAEALKETIFGKLGIFAEDGDVKPEILSRLETLNEKLDDLEIDALKVLPSSKVALIQEDEKAAVTANSKILAGLIKIDNLNSQLLNTEQSRTITLNSLTKDLEKEKALLANAIKFVNIRANAEIDRLGALEDSLEKVDNAIDFEKALGLSQDTIDEVLALNTALDAVYLSLERIALDGTNVDGGLLAKLNAQAEEYKKKLAEILGAPDDDDGSNDTSDKATKTPFEEFVDNLNTAGFGFSLEDAARLGAKAFERLKTPVAQVAKLNEKIVNSAIDDTKARKAAVKALKEQKTEIFKILSLGTVDQKQEAFAGFGVDPSLALESKRAQKLGIEIALNRKRLIQLNGEDLNLQKQVSHELERQEFILDTLVNKSEEAAQSIKEAFKTGFKELLKGKTTIEDFFNGLLDAISSKIIDTVVDSFVEAFFHSANLTEMFERMFQGLADLGDKSGLETGTSFKKGMDETAAGIVDTGSSSFFGTLTNGFQTFFGGLSSMFSTIGSFLLGSGGAGGLFSSITGFSFGSFLGLNAGGIVPSTPYSTKGVDSVPAMLTPGELVVPADKVNSFSGNQTVVNLSITGDISRQTRTEVIRMLPTIASGVNAQNKERNFKYS